MWTRAGTTEQRLARRARVILCCAEGLPIRDVGERCGLSQITVFKWKRHRAPHLCRVVRGDEEDVDHGSPGRAVSTFP